MDATPSVSRRAAVSLLLLGFATAVAQAVLLREAMAALGGSELAWGSVLALWLAGMGLGARLGVRLGTAAAATVVPAGVLVVAATGVILFRAAPSITGAAPGEALTTMQAIWVWVLAVLPAGLWGGLAFPALAAELGDSAGAYALEAGGALAGGLVFTFALAPLGTATTLCAGAGVVGAASLWRRRPAIAIALPFLAIATAFPASSYLAHAGWRWSGRPDALAAWRETRHQRLELASSEPAALYASGRLVASYPEPYITVPRAHLVMLLHSRPRHVLAIGCTADGSVSTMLRHPLESLHLVEEDPALPDLLRRWYGSTIDQALADRRVRVEHGDPVRALDAHDAWSLVAVLDGDPTTVRQNRARTVEFFRCCRDRMAPDGVLVLKVGVNDTYLGGAAGRLVGVLASTMAQVFPKVTAIPGESILLVAGRESAELITLPAALEQRWRDRVIDDPHFVPEMLTLLLDPTRAEGLERFVKDARAPVNSTDRPRAVLLAAGLAEAGSEGSLLRLAWQLERRSAAPLAVAVAAGCLVLLALMARRRWAGVAAAAVVGLSSMGWWLLLLAAWQATLGSVYAEVGALSGVFMGGLAVGAYQARRWPRPQARLTPILVGGVFLSALVATGWPGRLPEIVVPTLLVAGGWLTGAAFAGVARLAGRGDTRRGAGLGFAADEIGAATAALVVGLLAVPWAGARATALGLAALELAVLPVILLASRERR